MIKFNYNFLSVESNTFRGRLATLNTFLLNGTSSNNARANFRESIKAKGNRPPLDNLASTLLKKESFSSYKNGQKMVT